jgi:hypothetical protein
VRHPRWWLLLAVPAVVLLVGAAVAQRDTSDETPPAAIDGGDTPELTTTSAELPPASSSTTVPLADLRLRNDLVEIAARLPADSCLVVEGPGFRFTHREGVPLVPASTMKLLTASAALEALGADTLIATDRGDASVREVVGRVLRDSDATAAELLLTEITRAQATPVAGPAAILDLVDDDSVDLDGVVVADSSGRSRDNRVTCTALVDVLSRPGTGPLVREGLAVAGETGTLADRFVGTALQGVVRAKTGSLSSVSALAGVVGDDEPAATFALVVNAPVGTGLPADVFRIQQQVGEALVAWGVAR